MPQLEHLNINFLLNADEIKTKCNEIIKKNDKSLEAILSEKHPTFKNIVIPFAEAERTYSCESIECEAPMHVSPNEEIRTASTEASKKLSEYEVTLMMRPDLYEKIKSVDISKEENLTDEDKRYYQKVLLGYTRNGLDLPKQQQDELKEIAKQISELAIEYNSHLAEDRSHIFVKKEDLSGMNQDFIDSLEQVKEGDHKGEFKVTTKYPHSLPLLRQCENEETRKKMDFCFNNRCAESNVKIAETIFTLRHKAAVIKGYLTHASYILEIRMAKNEKNVFDFYSNLIPRLEQKAETELQELLDLKKSKTGDKFDGQINSFDFGFYNNMSLKNKYGIDPESLRSYFSLERVISETFSIYEELMSLQFTKLENIELWDEEVQTFSVQDSESKEFLGYFFLDLYPREGKYQHFACFGLQKGCTNLTNNTFQYPACAMVGNFPKATPDKPSLLLHEDFITFFHEFGHVLHNICARTKYSRFGGTSVERDFVEAPSQALENWCWEKQIIKRVSSHIDTKEPLSDEIIDQLVAAKNHNSGLANLRQVFFGKFDQTVHTNEKVDSAQLWSKLRKEITKISHTEGTNPTASFGHLIGGYDSSYYSYLYSEVFSADIFARFQKEGIMNKKVGMEYRKKILGFGGSRNAEEYLQNFLGRKPNQEAFLKSIGF